MKLISQSKDKIWRLAVLWPFLAILAMLGTANLKAHEAKVTNADTGEEYTDLQTAINEANPGDILELKGTFVGNFYISKSLTLNGEHHATLDGDHLGPVLQVIGSGNSVNLRHLKIENGLTAASGAGILNAQGALFLSNVEIFNNAAGAGGAGILNASGGSITLHDCKIHNNSAQQFGGGIANVEGFCSISDSSITFNSAGIGGGFYNQQSEANFNDVEIESNFAGLNGGGIYNVAGLIYVVDTEIELNTALQFGGGLYNVTGSTANFFNSEVENNKVLAPNGGGGIYSAATLNLQDTEVEDNIPNNITEV